MPFDKGSVTFRMCHLPEPVPENALEKFAEGAASPLEYVRDEERWGWVSGRHLLERRIDEETSTIAGYLHLALVKAKRKIPSSLLKAEIRMAELAKMAADNKERLSSKERKAIKEDVTERLLPDMPVTLTGTPFTIDANDNVLYVGATSDSVLDIFLHLIKPVLGYEPIPLTPETVAGKLYDINPETIPPLNFSPELPDGQATGSLGQNFLTWLWFFQEERNGVLPQTKLGEFSLLVDGPLVFVAEGPGALESAIRKGVPTVAAEAKAALTVGKKLSKAKLVLARGREDEWSVTIDADEFIFRGMKLPDGEVMDRSGIYEERMTNLYIFRTVFFALFEMFLKEFSDPQKVREFQEKAKRWVKERAGK